MTHVLLIALAGIGAICAAVVIGAALTASLVALGKVWTVAGGIAVAVGGIGGIGTAIVDGHAHSGFGYAILGGLLALVLGALFSSGP